MKENAMTEETIVVIEDDKSLNSIICNELIKNGYKTKSAFNGKDALKLIERVQPQAIVLDLKLPGVDGKEVLKHIRKSKDERKKNIPVVVATNLESVEDMNECIAQNISAYFIKADVSIKTLTETVINSIS